MAIVFACLLFGGFERAAGDDVAMVSALGNFLRNDLKMTGGGCFFESGDGSADGFCSSVDGI